ncbi:MAG: hypothetical protein R8K20_11915 [Gallionellaceae bacterium]
MNFIQLAQRLGRECGIAGTVPSVANQAGENGRLVDWINEAWVEVQLEREWGFRHATIPQQVLTIGSDKYAPLDFNITDLESWDVGSGDNIAGTGNRVNMLNNAGLNLSRSDSSIRIYRTSIADEQVLPFVDYAAFRAVYKVGSQAAARPICFTLHPDNSLMFAPMPDFAYILNAEYTRSAVEMVNSTDIPAIPASLHMMIVYRAMEFYGAYEDAPDVSGRGSLGYARMMKRMNRIDNARIEYATGSLA